MATKSNKFVGDCSDDELKAELEERAKERERKAREDHERYVESVVKHLTLDAVNALHPEHDRTSCDDARLGNGWGSADYGARCGRCALLETLRDGYIPYPFRFHVRVEA